MLLPAKTDSISKEKYCKKYAVGFFYSGSSKMVFILVIDVIAGQIVITPINVRKTCFVATLTRAFCSCEPGFYYCSSDILYIFTCINFWLGSKASKDGYQYIRKPLRWSLSIGNLVWASKKWLQPWGGRAVGFRDITFNPTRAFTSFKNYRE